MRNDPRHTTDSQRALEPRSRALRAALMLAAVLSGGCASMPVGLGRGAPACLPHFAYDQGWLGGDAVYSVPVDGGTSDHDTIWLFGDTYVGEPSAPDRSGATLIHNSVGLSRCKRDAEFEIEYAWRKDAAGAPRAIFEAERPRHYFWPFDGFFHAGQLHVLLLEVREDTPRGPFGLPIRITRSFMARVENPDDPPEYWRVSLRALTDENAPLLSPGVFVERGFVYMMATPNDDTGAHPRFLTRLPLDEVEAWPEDLGAALETFTHRGAWERGLHAANARMLMADNATEMTIDRLGPTGRYFAVYSAPLQSADDGTPSASPDLDASSIFMRTAISITGPWSKRQRLHVIGSGLEAAATPSTLGTICYAGKAHAEHSPAGVLALTFVCNLAPGDDGDAWAVLEAMQTRMDVYRPRVATHPWPMRDAFAPMDEAANGDGR